MAQSTRYGELLIRLKAIERHFLPAGLKFPPTSQYTVQEEDHGRAYVLLIHAEVESYLEDRVKEVVQAAQSKWQSHTVCTRTLNRLLRRHLDSQKKPWRPVVKSSDAVDAAINSYYAVVNSNNGVSETDLLSMLFPIGIEYQKLDSAWLATMSSFTSLRGTFAHTQIKLHQSIDPKGEYEKVKKQILPGIKKLDSKINRLL